MGALPSLVMSTRHVAKVLNLVSQTNPALWSVALASLAAGTSIPRRVGGGASVVAVAVIWKRSVRASGRSEVTLVVHRAAVVRSWSSEAGGADATAHAMADTTSPSATPRRRPTELLLGADGRAGGVSWGLMSE